MWLHTNVQYGVDTLVPRVQCKLTSTITCIDCTGIEMITDYDHAKTRYLSLQLKAHSSFRLVKAIHVRN